MELAFELELEVSPHRVFAAVTESRHLERWFCDACESEPEDGGRLTMRWHRRRTQVWPYEATWIDYEPPTRCTCRGGHEGYPGGNAGDITFIVRPNGSGATLEVRHALPDDSAYEPYARTFRDDWPRALDRLRGYLSPPAAARSTA
jgi:uncharacterized protein YndB with AHSA1/START domain